MENHSGDECDSVLEVLTEPGDRWDLGTKGEGRAEPSHGKRNRHSEGKLQDMGQRLSFPGVKAAAGFLA